MKGSSCTDAWLQKLDLGTCAVTPLVGKEPELVSPVQGTNKIKLGSFLGTGTGLSSLSVVPMC